jgi:2-dehydro-3-deoxy-D-arabinonate dehydratase
MKCLQVEDGGAHRLGLVGNRRVLVLTHSHESVTTALDLLRGADERGLDASAWRASAEKARAFEEVGFDDLLAGKTRFRPTVPVTPPEVWGAGVTYRRSADFREEGSGIYDRVYVADRPELFFKATAGRCAGPGQPIGRRRDSGFTASEPELALVLGASGRILGFTLANDVSAWDIERDNPLYLPQSKVYDGCFAFGPVVATPDEIRDPYGLELRCRVTRGGREVFAGSASTAQLKRRFPELVEWLRRSNGVPAGTVLSTGTGIIQPMDVGLEEGDVVTISCPEIGELVNPVAWV